MNPTRLAVAAVAGALLVFSFLLAPTRAHACSVMTGWEAPADGLQLPKSIPADGVVPIHLISWWGAITDLPTIEVTDPDGDEVEGSVSSITFDATSDTQRGREDVLLVWTPEAELPAQTSYTYRIDAGYLTTGRPIDEEFNFQTGADALSAVEPVSLEATAAVTETEGGYECCEDESFCGTCNGGDCSECWPTRYAYLPTVDAVAHRPTAEPQPQVYHRVRANGEVRRRLWQLDDAHVLSQTFDEDVDEPFCVDVETVRLRDGVSVASEEKCFTRSDLPAYEERPFEASPPKVCADKLALGASGCSATDSRRGAAPGTLAIVGVLVLAAGAARRRRNTRG